MKNQKNNLFLICLMLFLIPGCSSFGSLSKESTNVEETRAPDILTAKMLDNIPLPADAKVLDDRKAEERFSGETRILKLESSASLYDVANFFRQEMKKNGWTGNERNEQKTEDRHSIVANLDFSNAGEQANIIILTNTDDGSEIEITISRKIEFDVPLHECARKADRTADKDEFTIRANCWEDLGVLAEFFSEEFPKKGWTLSNQPEDPVSDKTDGKTVKIAFAKEHLRAVVSLVELGIDRTSVKILITKQ